MNRRLSPTLFKLILGMIILPSVQCVAAGGSCSTGATYLNASTEAYDTLASLGVTSCFYIAANGADSNNGTSESTPWLHAPGMGGCSGTCESTTPTAGEGFILRGGDTWHASSGTPMICSSGPCQWTWSWSGSNGSPIYIGVDPSWYSGSSWARPILSMDNPLTTSIPSSCSYDDSAISGIRVNEAAYVTVDNFEFTGKCWAQNISNGAVAYFYQVGPSPGASPTYNTIQNSYFHGWSMTSSAWDAHAAIGGYNASSTTHSIIANNVIDGSDSTNFPSGGANCSTSANGTGYPCGSGWAIGSDCYDVHDNVIRYVSNFECSNITTVHDNLVEYLWPSYNGVTLGGPHPNLTETVSGYSGLVFALYNNIVRHGYMNVTFWPQYATAYEFNNVVWDVSSVQTVNCFMNSPVGNSGGSAAATLYFYNNTVDGACSQYFYGQAGNSTTAWVGGAAYYENNQFITSGQTAVSGLVVFGSAASGTVTDKGSEVFQTEAVANGQGYTTSDNYAPTLGSGATVGAGANLVSFCTSMPNSAASIACQSGIAGVTYNISNHTAVVSQPVPRSPSGAWDVGAYQFGSAPAAPTGLTAVVN